MKSYITTFSIPNQYTILILHHKRHYLLAITYITYNKHIILKNESISFPV